jgi:hypothetical protein
MWSYESQIDLMLAILRRLKWPLLFLFYDILIFWKPIPAILVLAGLMAAAFQAYQMDLAREQQSSDDFRGDGLFYRYGWSATEGVWPIPVKPEWSAAEVKAFADALRQKLAEKIRLRLPSDAAQVLAPVFIEDKRRSVRKEFVRTLAKTPLGSMVTHFIHFASFGRSITLQYESFIRGTYHWFDLAKFIAESPISIWFWGWPWLQNSYSVVSRISNFSGNSYDRMDVTTIFSTTHQLVLDEIIKLLEEEGVLSPELKEMILQKITNVQNIHITKSSGVRIGSISQAASAPAASRHAA